MVLTLLLTSCAEATEEKEEEAAPPTKEEAVPPAEEGEVVPGAQEPRYGGIFIQGQTARPLIFDDTISHVYFATTLHLTNEELVTGNWAKGPTGSGEASFLYSKFPAPAHLVGSLAESWEVSEPGTLVFHIRKGVRFHNKPPANGRELVAEDVAFCLNRLWDTPSAYQSFTYPWVESITATDKWTVVLKCLPEKTGLVHEAATGYSKIFPKEAVEQYGNMNDWENSCGTGPFVLVDYVLDSSVTFERNPTYWGKDPLHPDNTLPYLDGVKWLIIPDMSTQLAALRTGKIDHIPGLGWEDALTMRKTNPELEYLKYYGGWSVLLALRIDKPDIPTYDKRVRRALAMAINSQELAKELYQGDADILTYPIPPIPEFKDIFVPLEGFPDSVQELFEYNPEKAKQLLAEAGYPDGFKTEVICMQGYSDLLSLIKAYWADIGVDLEIDVREYGAYVSIGYNRTHEELYISGFIATMPDKFLSLVPGDANNWAVIDDPRINEAYDAVTANYFNYAEANRLLKDVVPYILDQCFYLVPPVPKTYTFWQPWVKGYNGELQVSWMNFWDWPKYLWIDQDLKEEMTGRR